MLRIFSAILISLLFLTASGAQESLTENQEKRVKELVREYLLANPEIIRDALITLQQREQVQQRLAQTTNLENLRTELTKSSDDPVGGNVDGSITVVEFFDYNCPYCRRAKPEVLKLLNNDKRVRYVFKEFPVLSETSVVAARIALAVWKTSPEKYFVFHNKLMSIKGRVSEHTMRAAADAAGLDWAVLTKRAGQSDIDSQLQKTVNLADKLQISGTPTFVIGREIIPGFVSYDKLQAAVNRAVQ